MPIACAELRFVERNGRTVLQVARAELPLAIQRPLRGPRGEAVVVLLTPAGALFDGDSLRLEVTCGPRVDLTLTTVGATRVNRCDLKHVRFELHASVACGATLRYLPHELIPFRGADYRQSINMQVDCEAQVWLSEIVGPGAIHEQFTYNHLEFETDVWRSSALVAREHFVLRPESREQLTGYTHYGSLLLIGPDFGHATATAITERLAHERPAQVGGASALPYSGVGVKVLGASAQAVRRALLNSAGCPTWLTSTLLA